MGLGAIIIDLSRRQERRCWWMREPCLLVHSVSAYATGRAFSSHLSFSSAYPQLLLILLLLSISQYSTLVYQLNSNKIFYYNYFFLFVSSFVRLLYLSTQGLFARGLKSFIFFSSEKCDNRTIYFYWYKKTYPPPPGVFRENLFFNKTKWVCLAKNFLKAFLISDYENFIVKFLT